MRNVIIILLFISAISCRNENREQRNLDSRISAEYLETITVNVDDFDFDQLGNWLKADKYVKLAPTPLLSVIKDIQIREGKIFIHDAFARIVCYDMQGKLLWLIDAEGVGPGEYTSIHELVINTETSEVVIYDNPALSLLFYDMKTGRYLRTEKLFKPNPTDIAFADGLYFYDSQYHNNYPNDTMLHYSLLTSRDGINIEQRFFKHDDSEAEYMFSDSPKNFYYSDSLLLYCKNFDNIIYQIGANRINARYQINLPDPLPCSFIEDKINPIEMLKSSYSSGITNVYECGSLLYFCYTKGDAYMMSLYDRDNQEMIYSGRRMFGGNNPNLPLLRLMDGVYKGQFFSVLTPEYLGDSTICSQPAYPDVLRDYNSDDDNPVIAFYDVIRSQSK
ncbi:6-bladed beta-propeller [Bacteroides sp. UBA939]|uniref:6-bladed beta-propeller n=1 Tax=Bacteroides sp. UBA939 TaxID=1946092 RepID=UPI0025BD390A|nr:6-bladed beta-propeller [Bacteroides sp. UBA939]